MNVDHLVLHEGDHLRAWGRLVETGSKVTFNPPLWKEDVEYRAGPPAPEHTTFAVPMSDADFDTVTDYYERDGAREGWTTVEGSWRGDSIQVERQHRERFDAPEPRPRWVDPPCPPPAGGWPTTGKVHADLGDLQETGAIVRVVVFRPNDTSQVLVVVANDRAAAEARLRPQLGDSLCIVDSRWTRPQLDGVREDLQTHWRDWQLHGLMERAASDGQPYVEARPSIVTPEIAEWARPLPDGLTMLAPWLHPTTSP
jgi:hypothetical protein